VSWLAEDLPRLAGALFDNARQLVDGNATGALAVAAGVTLVAFAGWLRAARRSKQLRRDIDRLRGELQELDAKYRGELKWRSAAERYQAKHSRLGDDPKTEPEDVTRREEGAPESAPGVAALSRPTPIEHGARKSSPWYRVLLVPALLLVMAAVCAVVWPEAARVLSPYGTGFISAGLALALASTPLLALMLYFGPSFLAGYQQHTRTPAIFAINLCFGWTIIGWLGALAWSATPALADDRK
jgi:hypothetical protein